LRCVSALAGGGLAALIAAQTGCSLREPLLGCKSDRDCKLERICEAGRCIWPPANRPPRVAAAVPKPPPAPAPAPAPEPPDLTADPTPTSAPTPASALRPMFRFGPDHRGRSPTRLPGVRPEIVWTYATHGPVTSSPAVSDGVVLVGSHDGQLHVVDRAGKALWTFATGDLIFSSPAVFGAGGAGVAYVGSDDDYLYALNLTTHKPVWRFKAGACPRTIGVGPEASRCDVDAGPTVGPDGVVYTGGDAVYAINPDGSLRWRFVTGGHVSSAPALLPDGTVVAGCQDNLVYAIAPNGTKRWDFRAGDDVESAPAVAEDGTIYFGSDDQKLYALSPAGAMLWAFTAGDDIRASPALGADGTIYVGSFDSLFYAVRRDGTLAWSFRTGDRILSSALVDDSGAVLFGSQDDRLYALEPDGRHRWSVELGGDVDSSPVMDGDGTIYVGSDDRNLYALRAPVSGNLRAAKK
jgi:outer membrane protein assembly factor BamB